MSRVILPVSLAAFDEIATRIVALGPDYQRDFIALHPAHGPLITFGETCLAVKNWWLLESRVRHDLWVRVIQR